MDNEDIEKFEIQVGVSDMRNTTAFQHEVADLLIGVIALVLALLLWSRIFAAAVC
jgi:hypothetical protein